MKLWQVAFLFCLVPPAAGVAQMVDEKPEARLSGKVTDKDGTGLERVQIKVFADGFLQAVTGTSADGAYEIPFFYDPTADQTLAVWWTPARTDQVPELVLLRESRVAQSMKLWSPCIPRLELAPFLSHDVVLLSEAEKLRALGEADCMRDAAAPLRPKEGSAE